MSHHDPHAMPSWFPRSACLRGLAAISLLSCTVVGAPGVARATPQQAEGTVPAELLAARSALDSGRVEDAIDIAEGYMYGHRHDPRGHLALGDALAQLHSGRLRALRAYREARRLAPADPEPPYRMVQLALELGGADGERIAAENLERVLALDPFYGDAWNEWLLLFRNDGKRRDMIERLEPYAGDPKVRVRIALLLIENEEHAAADSLIDSALRADSMNVAWLALRAQSALEAGDTLVGIGFYQRALASAPRDSTDALWRHVIGIATPSEVRAWQAGIPAEQKGAWLRSFWARRHPNLFRGVNERVVQHFARWRVARRKFPLLHPLLTYHRSAAGRGLNLEPSVGEREFHQRCEVYQALPSYAGRGRVPLPGVARARDRARVSMGELSHLTRTEIAEAEVDTKLRLARNEPTALAGGGGDPFRFAPTLYAPLGLDVRSVDSTAGRVGYNLATGLSDRGIMYLRFGDPNQALLGGDNSADPRCNTTELERWRYAEWGEVRFSKPNAFSEGLRTVPEMVFRPMNQEQFEVMELGLTRDAPDEPAPLEFGVWTAQFRSAWDAGETDLIVVSTRGALAATLVPALGGARGVHRRASGRVALTDVPGEYLLVAHAQDEGKLGRQSLRAELRGFHDAPSLSDLLLSKAWNADAPTRDEMVEQLEPELEFSGGETVRTYAEVYGLGADAGRVRYHGSYLLLRTSDPARDAKRETWQDAVSFDFDRNRPVPENGVSAEVLDISPEWTPEGTYLLRLEVRDLVTGRPAGRATIAFKVED